MTVQDGMTYTNAMATSRKEGTGQEDAPGIAAIPQLIIGRIRAVHAQQDGAVMETARLIMGDVLLDLVLNLLE